MLRESGVFPKLPNGKKFMADGGFRGEPRYITHPFPRRNITPERRLFNKRISNQRWRIESAFRRLKGWKALAGPYRHDVRKHWMVWKVSVFLYNADVKRHPLSKY